MGSTFFEHPLHARFIYQINNKHARWRASKCMDPNQTRRQLLTGVGVAGAIGLAGCTNQLFQRSKGGGSEEEDPEDGENADREAESESELDDDTKYFHSGDTIPTYPYGDIGFDPTDSTPDLKVDNPVFTADDIDEERLGELLFVADPFMFVEENEWHMFIEAVESGHGGRIVHAQSDDQGVSWEYTGIVLEEDWHLSFSLPFKWDGDYYMTVQANPSSRPPRLYKANSFPDEWFPVLDGYYDQTEYGHGINDHAIFRWNDMWWDIAGDANEDTYLYYSDTLETSDWQPHEANPVVEGRPFASRPGGRPIVLEDRIFIPYQQTDGLYGESIQGFWITALTEETYEDEHAGTVLEGTERYTDDDEPAWNSLRMHHYEPWYLGEDEGWRAVVDGDKFETPGANWSIGMYHTSD